MPSYRVITPLRRNRKTVPPGEIVTLVEDEAGELLRKRAIELVETTKPERPEPPPPGDDKGKPAGKRPAAAKATTTE